MFRRKVLIADDDPIVIERTGGLLRELGCDVISHYDGLGLSALILRERPDVVLVDVMMPRLSGDQILRLIKDNNLFEELDIVYILYSSKDSEALKELVEQSGAEGAIQKSAGDEAFKTQFLRIARREPETK